MHPDPHIRLGRVIAAARDQLGAKHDTGDDLWRRVIVRPEPASPWFLAVTAFAAGMALAAWVLS